MSTRARLGVLFIAALLLVSGCTLRSTRPAARPLSVFVSVWTSADQFPAQAALVRRTRAKEPCVWLVLGNPFSDRVWTSLSDGEAQTTLLSAAGVDAVLLEPAWLEFGQSRLRQLLSRASFYALNANVLDSLAETVGHAFMIRTFDGVSIGFTGVWLDSTDFRFMLRGIKYSDPDFAVRKNVPLIRARADLAGVIAQPKQDVAKWNVDLVAGAYHADILSVVPADRGLARVSLQVQDTRVVEYSKTEPSIERLVDAPTKAVLDSLQAALGLLSSRDAARLTRELSPTGAARVAARSALKGGADGLLFDAPLLRGTLRPGPVTNRNLIEALDYPGRLARLSITGAQLKTLLSDRSAQIEWRAGLRNHRVALNRRYEVVATPDFYARRLRPLGLKYELEPEPLWKAVVSETLGGE